LSKTGNTALKIFKFAGSAPITILQMLFTPQPLGRVPLGEEDFENAVVRALIDFCMKNKTE
jgi:hypothetical protein